MATLESAITGAIASAMANTAVYPLDLSKTLIQTQHHHRKKTDDDDTKVDDTQHRKYKNVFECMKDIFNTKGIKGLYQGCTTSVAGTFIMNFCYFFWYTLIRKRYIKFKLQSSSNPLRISTIEELLIGIIAATMSQVFTSPIAVISTRQQTIHDPESAKFANVVKDLYKQSNGDITAFWKGLKVGLMLTLNPSITYTSYQRLKKIIFKSSEQFDSDTLSPWQNFFLGVVSKCISTIITQPLIVAKASLQSVGSHYQNFQQVLLHLYKHEGLKGLWKGLLPQLTKGVIVQGLLFMFKGELAKRLNQLLLILSIIMKRRLKPSPLA
ncbi:peroxisomal adenine nucleotide transporter 1 [Monosporozyma unispora]|nr:ADP/ATP carrier protein [Kazachstania unispora]